MSWHSIVVATLVACLTLEASAARTPRLHGAHAPVRSVLHSRAAPRVAARMVDASAVHSLVHGLPDALGATHALLADAAAAAPPADVASAGTGAASDPNIFDQYVSLIRTSIVSLHESLFTAGVPYAYAASIFLFTLCVKLFVLPLNWKQMEGTVAMQKLAPQQKQLQKWFGDNPQALQIQTSMLYSENQVNPLAGCLPSLLQIPVFIGLYRAIIGLSKDNVLSESFLWIPTLEGPVSEYGAGLGWLTDNWVDGHPSLGWHDTLCYLTLPLVLVLSQSLSMRILTPPTVGETSPDAERTQQILKFLPFMIGWFALSAPAGLGLYWFFNNVITTAQSIFIRSMLGAYPGQGSAPDEEATPSA